MNVRAARDLHEAEALSRVLAASFTFSPEDAAAWIEAAGPDQTRVLVQGGGPEGVGGDVQAGLLLVPAGQFFGGRRVPMCGLAAVGVLPELRGRGLGRALVRQTLRDLHAQGHAISALYPSTLPLYRSLGWEIAGARWEIRLDPRGALGGDRTLPMRRATADDVLSIRALHLQRARRTPGAIDRNPFLWDRVLAPRGTDAEGYVVGDDTVSAYVFFTRDSKERGHFELTLTDFAAADAASLRRLLAFFGDHATLCDRIIWRGHPDDALLAAMPDRHWTVRQLDPWMLRVVNVPAALEARGAPAGFSASLVLDVTDPELPENHGLFTVTWSDGGCTVVRADAGTAANVKLDVRALGALFTSHKSPAQLAAADLLSGDDDALALLGTAFAGPMPVMWDGF